MIRPLSLPGQSVASPSVAVVGAGFGGIAVGVALKRQGVKRFTIYERSPAAGGTWHDNVYPGAEVDTPSILYSFSFMPWNWSRTHVGREELQGYIEAVVDRYDLREHIRFECGVSSAEWQEYAQRYRLELSSGQTEYANVVVTATGLLNDPKYPTWPGLESFKGPSFHTSRWEPGHDTAGKTIAVVGSGSSATQAVPELAKTAKKVLMFQREPGWIAPKSGREYTDAERRALGSALAQRIVRRKMLFGRERFQFGSAAFREGTPRNLAAEAASRAYIMNVLGDRPDLVEAVTPSYPYGGKRVILGDTLYPALLRENVQLIPKAVERITATGVVDIDGVEHSADWLVLATGFKSTFLTTLDVKGVDGRSIHEVWKGEPEAFLGLMVPNFPNFFMIYGPNTNGGAIVSNLELQAKYVVSAVRHLIRSRATAVEVKPRATAIFNRMLQHRLQGTLYQTFANNYYKSASGKVVTQWPDGLIPYAVLTKLFRRSVWNTRRVVLSSREPEPSGVSSYAQMINSDVYFPTEPA